MEKFVKLACHVHNSNNANNKKYAGAVETVQPGPDASPAVRQGRDGRATHLLQYCQADTLPPLTYCICLDYHSVCPSSELGYPPHLLSRKPAGEEGSQFGRLAKKPRTPLQCNTRAEKKPGIFFVSLDPSTNTTITGFLTFSMYRGLRVEIRFLFLYPLDVLSNCCLTDPDPEVRLATHFQKLTYFPFPPSHSHLSKDLRILFTPLLRTSAIFLKKMRDIWGRYTEFKSATRVLTQIHGQLEHVPSSR